MSCVVYLCDVNSDLGLSAELPKGPYIPMEELKALWLSSNE